MSELEASTGPGAESPTSPSVSQKDLTSFKENLTGVSLQATAGVKNQLSGQVIPAHRVLFGLSSQALEIPPWPLALADLPLLWSLHKPGGPRKVGL